MGARREEFIQRKAEEAGRDCMDRFGRIPPKEDFGRLKIQVMDPLLRFALLIVAAFSGFLAFWLHGEVGNLPLTLVIGGLSVLFAALAAFGRRDTVESALGEVANFVYNRLLER